MLAWALSNNKDMNGSTKWYLSRSIWGSVAVLLGASLRLAGFEVSDAELQSTVDAVLGLASLTLEVGGTVVALYGRIKATKVIK